MRGLVIALFYDIVLVLENMMGCSILDDHCGYAASPSHQHPRGQVLPKLLKCERGKINLIKPASYLSSCALMNTTASTFLILLHDPSK